MTESITEPASPADPAEQVLEALSQLYPQLTPQLRKAARYLMDNRVDVAIQSIRKSASEAGVTPSTLMRLAKSLSFERYDELRQVFQQALQERPVNFGSRADSLQSLADSAEPRGVVGEVARTAYADLGKLFSDQTVQKIQQTAALMLNSPRVFVLGFRDTFACAYHLAYVGRIALPGIRLIRGQEGSLLTDLSEIRQHDLLIAFGFEPYSREVVEAVSIAVNLGARVVAITDNLRSPLVPGAELVLSVATETPHFFPSIVASVTLTEAILAECVATGGKQPLANIRRFEEQMQALGGYYDSR